MKNTSLKILHLEDNQTDAELLYIELKDSFPNMEYHLAKNKKEFVKALKENTYQLILADYNVPHIVGNEALELALKYHPNTPVIFVSGNIDAEKAIEILRQGATDYVMKNNLMRLAMIVDRALQEKQEKLDKEKIKNALKESEKKFKKLSDLTFEGIVIHDKGIVIDINLSFEKMFGYSREEVIGKEIIKLINPKKYLDILPKSLSQKHSLPFEMEALRKDGSLLSIEVEAKNISTNKDETIRVAAIRDITERKKAEANLKESEIKLKEAHEITRLGTFIFNESTGTFESSQIFDEIVGIDKSYTKDLQGWINLAHPDDFDEGSKLFMDDDVVNILSEFRIIRPNDKKIIWGLIHAKKEYDSKGKRCRLICTLQDITERKLFEEKIKQSDTILNKIDSIVKVVDKKGSVLYASPSIKNILGYEPKDMLGQGWWRKTTSSIEEADRVRDAVLYDIQKGIPVSDEIASRKIKTKEGKERLFQWVTSKGVGNSFIFIGIDITEKYEKEIQYKTLTDTAQNAIILANHKGLIIEWNKAAQQMFGYTKEEILNKPLTLLMPKKYMSQHIKGFSEANKKGLTNVKKLTILEGLSKEGHIFPIEMSFNQWENNGDNVYCAFINDITERRYEEKTKEIIYNITKKATETVPLDIFFNFIKLELSRLINTSNFFIALYDETTDMISMPFVVDEKEKISDFPKGKTFTGYVIDSKKSLLAGEDVFKKIERAKKIKLLGLPPKCWLGVPLLLNDKAIGAIVIQSYTDEKTYTQKDVTLLELIASSISQVIKNVRDFEKINLLNQTLIQSPEAIMITNTKGIIEYVNPAFTSLNGYSAEEALGKTPNLLQSGEQAPEVYNELWKTIINGRIWEGELINKRKDGSSYLVDAKIAPVKNKKGDITHFIAVEEDITKKRQLERDFINAFIDAQETEKQSFGEELHDGISQILAAQGMYIDILLRLNKDNEDIIKHLDKIKELNLDASTDTRNIAHGLMSKQLKERGLINAIKQICDDYNQSKSIDFKFQHSRLINYEFSKDIKTNIFRISQEITTNIARYSMATKAFVSLTKNKDNKLELIIKDNGVGFDLEKIKEENKGTGLKNIERRVTLLNGDLTLDTAPNKGTCYTIIVPLDSTVKLRH